MARDTGPARSAKRRGDVEVGAFDGIERCVTTGRETGDRHPRASPERRNERLARTQHRSRPLGFECDELTQRRGRRPHHEIPRRAAEAFHVFSGQVDPPAHPVLGDVLEMLDDLESAADLIGARQVFRTGRIENPEHELTDRSRR